jgi:replication factor C large subunit
VLLRFGRIGELEILKFLKYVGAKEKIKTNDRTLRSIAKSCDGDVRAALIDLEIGSALRERSGNVFEVLRSVFREKQLAGDVNFDVFFMWVSENIPEEFKQTQDIADAYDCLSKADLFRARIMRRQAWGLQKYFSDFLLAMPKSKRQLNVIYKPPAKLRRINEQTLEKIGSKLHVSKREAAKFFPLVKTFLDEEMAEEFEFDANDLEAIRSS